MIKDIEQQNENTTPNSKQLAVLKEHFRSCFKAELAATTNVVQEGYEVKFLGKSYAKLLRGLDLVLPFATFQ